MAFNSLHQNWWARHVSVIVLASALLGVFLFSRAEWSPMHLWNRAFGDVSLVLTAAAMALGPMARLWRKMTRFIAYRRELGIYAIILATVHTVIILIGWVNLDLMRLIGFEFHPDLQRYVMLDQGFGLANLIGVLALLYGVVLAITSNDRSMRLLGGTVWKFVQQGTYVLWALSVVHAAYFLFMHFLDFHRQTPEPNWFRWPFVILVLVVLGLQIAASTATWRNRRVQGGISEETR